MSKKTMMILGGVAVVAVLLFFVLKSTMLKPAVSASAPGYNPVPQRPQQDGFLTGLNTTLAELPGAIDSARGLWDSVFTNN